MEKAQDIRSVRTFQALQDAMFSLLEKHNFNEITVIQLCEEAQLKRATFYKHFKDLTVFMDYCIVNMFHELFPPICQNAPPTTKADFVAGLFDNIFSFLEKHRNMLKINIEKTKTNTLLDLIHTAISAELSRRGKDMLTRGYSLNVPAPIICEYYTGAYMALIKWWLLSETDVSKDDMISYVLLLISQKEMSFSPV